MNKSTRRIYQLLIIFITFSFPFAAFSQDDSTYIIRGKIRNYDQPYFALVQDAFLDWKNYNIVVDTKGNFFREIQTESLQDFIVELNNETYTFFAKPGDTITLTWDQKNFSETFAIQGNQKGRNGEYKAILELFALEKSRPKNEEDKIDNNTKFNRINAAYNEEIKVINGYPSSDNFDKIAYDVYYKYMGLLLDANLIDKFKLTIANPLVKDILYKNIPVPLLDYSLLNEIAFNKSTIYRKFLYRRIKMHSLFNGLIALEKSERTTNFKKSQYLMGQAVLNIRQIRDWYGAMIIKDGFEGSEYTNTLEIYNRYLLETEDSYLKRNLIKYYSNLKNLSVGQPAPGFTLKDIEGKMVSLSDFNGKVVYIDFWGVHCGPCRLDILENSAKVHEKYKSKNVVFLNICTDETEQPWKRAIASLKLNGVNLITESANNSEVSKNYNIKSIPRYVVIDREGKIFSSSAQGLWDLLPENENILDLALKK
jgi:peroxiredoxin